LISPQERVRVIDAAKMVLEYTGHKAEIKLRPDMPTGPLNRVADNSLAKKLLSWEPQVPFREGLKRTITGISPPRTGSRCARSWGGC